MTFLVMNSVQYFYKFPFFFFFFKGKKIKIPNLEKYRMLTTAQRNPRH